METGMYLRCLGIGLTCGLRSMTGPAVVRWRARDPIRLALAGLAAGELVADKLPGTPPRTIPPALLFRALSGGFSARSITVLFDAGPDARTSGTIIGALGAIAGAYAGMAVRAAIVRSSRLPDPLVALAEDALAIGGAVAASRK